MSAHKRIIYSSVIKSAGAYQIEANGNIQQEYALIAERGERSRREHESTGG